MKKKAIRRLRLTKETLQELQERSIRKAAGGVTILDSSCIVQCPYGPPDDTLDFNCTNYC